MPHYNFHRDTKLLRLNAKCKDIKLNHEAHIRREKAVIGYQILEDHKKQSHRDPIYVPGVTIGTCLDWIGSIEHSIHPLIIWNIGAWHKTSGREVERDK